MLIYHNTLSLHYSLPNLENLDITLSVMFSKSKLSLASNPEVTSTSMISHIVDQATLSTMQAEMIAVQVLSQSASGDIQYLQQQTPQQFIPIVSGADANTLSTLQATLGQMPLAAVQV